MFEAHSYLWHYLWVAPNLLSALLAVMLWKRDLLGQFRTFFLYACYNTMQWAVLYTIDLSESTPPVYYWVALCVGLVVECIILFLLVSDIAADVFGSYAAIAHFGRLLIRWGCGVLLLVATVVMALAGEENPAAQLIPASHKLQLGMSVVVTGLLLLLFGMAAYFHLRWDHRFFGIAFGLGIIASVHLATWAIMANGKMPSHRPWLDMFNMATFHVAVLLWLYYLLVPKPARVHPPLASLPDNALTAWNRELERFLHTRKMAGRAAASPRGARPLPDAGAAKRIELLDLQAFRNLADPAEDTYLRQRLPAAEFRRLRRMRLRAMAAYVKAAGRNAAFLIEVGQGALANADPIAAEVARELVNQALWLRRNAVLAQLKIYAGLAWPLSPLGAFPILDGYQQLSHAAMLLGRIQDPSPPVRISSGPAGP